MPQWADSEPSVHSRAAAVHCDDNTPAVRNGRRQHPQTKGPSARPDGIPRTLARHAVMGAPSRAIRAQTDATSLVLLGNRLYSGQPRDSTRPGIAHVMKEYMPERVYSTPRRASLRLPLLPIWPFP